MKKGTMIWIAFTSLLLVHVLCFSQRSIPATQRTKIDSLKKLLLTSDDSAKADCLNRLSFEFTHYNSDTNQHWSWWNPDTARIYAEEAYNLSRKINYDRGSGDALGNLGGIAFEKDFTVAENYLRQALLYYEKAGDEARIAGCNAGIGWYAYAQSKFEESRLYEEKALNYFIRVQNKSMIAMLYRMIGFNWGTQGYVEKAFECARRDDSTMHTMNTVDAKNAIYSPRAMGQMYDASGDHEKALHYFRISAEEEAKHYRFPEDIYEDLAEAFAKLHQYDSAEYYYKVARSVSPVGNFNIADLYLQQKRYAEAIPHYLVYLQIKKTQHDNNQVMFTLENLATCYQALDQLPESVPYARNLVDLAKQTKARPLLQSGYEFLWNYFDKKRIIDSAYKYHRQLTAIKDSLSDNEFIKNIAVFEMKTRNEQQQSNINLLSKENQLKETKLQREKLVRNITIIIGLIGLLVAFLIVRNTVLAKKKEHLQRLMSKAQEQLEIGKKEQQVAELEHQKTELEMQVLRSQMNPHFIFNSLSSINRFILQNNKSLASEYLTKFSKLMRLILQNSQAPLISLESELESLKLYLDLEALRFNYRFGYKISLAPDLETSIIKVPPLIIQPYVENAIWHGLMHKEENGQLDIEISQENEHLFIKITDDGVGREQSVKFGSKSATLHKPMGLRITADRISMLELSYVKESTVKINDLVHPTGKAAGTEVTIKIPAIYD